MPAFCRNASVCARVKGGSRYRITAGSDSNVGMCLFVMPVVGLTLPFFSYGGSSLIAFTILLFVAIKLDASKHELLT